MDSAEMGRKRWAGVSPEERTKLAKKAARKASRVMTDEAKRERARKGGLAKAANRATKQAEEDGKKSSEK